MNYDEFNASRVCKTCGVCVNYILRRCELCMYVVTLDEGGLKVG